MPRRPSLTIPLLGIAVLLAGCDAVFNAINSPGVDAGVRALLRQAQVEPQGLVCRMVDTTRAAVCSVSLSGPQADAVIRNMALEPVPVSAISDGLVTTDSMRVSLPTRSRDHPPGCAGDRSRALATYRAVGGEQALRYGKDGAFSYFFLTLDRGSGRGCIEVAYSYG